jgi:lipopolysaccharide transport system ATP-binding protein
MTVITVEQLGKKYTIGHQRQERYVALRDVLAHTARGAWQRLRHPLSPNREQVNLEEIWALKDVNFEVKQGERIGIIGRNGAGKTTLLKILSRITQPTTGRVRIKGRVASLLEVGTGFHPELTGRENIYLNGAILGMTRQEIKKKFDEIVAFAEVEKFLDTPVKRYSSGMYVRLAFAVAAHLDPEILLVDEVLAVGDLAFQKKCLGKMQAVAGQGRTVLFVSHNIQAVRALCPRSMLLHTGKSVIDGQSTDTIVAYYNLLRQLDVTADTDVLNPKNRRGSGSARFTTIKVEDASGQECFEFMIGSSIRFRLSYQTFAPVDKLFISVAFRSGGSREIVTSVMHLVAESILSPGDTGSVIIEIPNNALRPGEYPLYFWLGDGIQRPLDVVDDLTLPLTIYTDQEGEDWGINPSQASGFFNIESRCFIS